MAMETSLVPEAHDAVPATPATALTIIEWNLVRWGRGAPLDQDTLDEIVPALDVLAHIV